MSAAFAIAKLVCGRPDGLLAWGLFNSSWGFKATSSQVCWKDLSILDPTYNPLGAQMEVQVDQQMCSPPPCLERAIQRPDFCAQLERPRT